jgi:protein-tyrosine phosphatase
MTAPSVSMMMEIAHLGTAEINRGGKVSQYTQPHLPHLTLLYRNIFITAVIILLRLSLHLLQIAVHCHAGYGRTGMAIACILIFKDQVESAQVITFIRNRR